MSLLGWGKAQFLDIIEWLDDSNDTMAWRFPMRGQEIQNGGKLVVRESQEAVFVNEGQFADCFKPGTHTLNTKNLPILATLKGWKYGFESPFKSDVYFLNTKLFNDLGWGTPNPIMMRDADFGMLRIRAFGIYSIRVADSKNFLKNVVGTNGLFTIADIQDQLRAFFGLDETIFMHPYKGGFICFLRQFFACGAVGFIADDQVNFR